ncbi:MAG: hypothetical protein HY298_25685 [Verrucomicrobia bacterium]|nr:hypothetical protein [Verrucomicrobiota bacterium]
MKITKLTKLNLIVIGELSLVCTSPAALIAYESFNYPVGSTLSNQNGGTGWMAPWTGANLGGGGSNPSELDFVITNGYSWSNSTSGYIVGNGGAIFDHDSANAYSEARQWFDPSNPLNDITTLWGTNIWFSFIATYDVASGSGGSVNLFESANDSVGGAGVVCLGPAGSNDFIVQIRAPTFGQGQHSGTTAQIQSSMPGTNLVVGRFQLAPGPQTSAIFGNDRLDVWLNQTKEPTNGSELFFTGFAADHSAPFSSGYAGIRTGVNCEMTIDEFRIGTTFADVVPATAVSPNPKPPPPLLSLENAGPDGLQLNTSEATPANFNEIVSYYTTNSGGAPVPIECAWVGKAPASYAITIAKPPAHGPSNFMAYVWLIPNWNGHIIALDNPTVLQLAIISDGRGGAKAVLGYYANSGNNAQANLDTLFTTGVMATLSNAPFAGTWTLRANSDTSFTIIAPNNAQASGSLQTGDEANFASQVKFFLGVSPNGGSNIGNPSLGFYMTVSDVTITNNTDGLVVRGDFTNGQQLDVAQSPPNFLPAANFPSCIYVMPTGSVYRTTWHNATGPGVGQNSLETTNALGGSVAWPNTVPSTSVLSDGTNVTFVTKEFTTNNTEFFRVSIPYSP